MNEFDDIIGIEIFVDNEFFGDFYNYYIQDFPEDVTTYREMKFLTKLPDLVKRMKNEEFVITEEIQRIDEE